MDIRRNSDSGTPIVVSDPGGAHAATYKQIAGLTVERLAAERGESASRAPTIIIE
jgi:ATP-binding protein involved in chromosome partitioning